MDTDKNRLKPAFDFFSSESSVLLYQGQAEMCIEKKNYAGDGEIRLDFLPQTHIHLYGNFSGVTFKNPDKISSFSINGHQIEGFVISLGGDATTKQ